MAANYWESTQRRHWQFTKDELADMRQQLEDQDAGLVQMFPLPQWRHLNMYFNQQINRLGKRLNVRQQAMATAQVYLKRFYTKVEIRRTNPYLMMATAVYLACKMEESPQHIRLVATEARNLWTTDVANIDTGKLGECEFFLISEMNSQLIVHQPYRTLNSLHTDFGLNADEFALAWSVINDHYMTDLPILYAPHIVALVAIILSLVLRPSTVPGASGNNTGSAVGSAGGQQNMGAVISATLQQAQSRSGMTGTNTPTTPGMTPSSSTSSEKGSENKRPPDARMGKVQRFAQWLSESTIDVPAMVDCTQELVSFYECHEQYNEKLTREQINRYIKARGLDK